MSEEIKPPGQVQDQMPGSAPDAVAATVEPELVTEPEKAPEPTWKKALKFILKFGVSAGILTYIICTRDIEWKDFTLVPLLELQLP